MCYVQAGIFIYIDNAEPPAGIFIFVAVDYLRVKFGAQLYELLAKIRKVDLGK